jgi:hypothetical protein
LDAREDRSTRPTAPTAPSDEFAIPAPQTSANPVTLGSFEMETTREDPADLPAGFWTTHDPKVRPGLPGEDDLAYFSWYAEGVVIVDIDDAIAGEEPEARSPEPDPDEPDYGRRPTWRIGNAKD